MLFTNSNCFFTLWLLTLHSPADYPADSATASLRIFKAVFISTPWLQSFAAERWSTWASSPDGSGQPLLVVGDQQPIATGLEPWWKESKCKGSLDSNVGYMMMWWCPRFWLIEPFQLLAPHSFQISTPNWHTTDGPLSNGWPNGRECPRRVLQENVGGIKCVESQTETWTSSH